MGGSRYGITSGEGAGEMQSTVPVQFTQFVGFEGASGKGALRWKLLVPRQTRRDLRAGWWEMKRVGYVVGG